MNASSIAPGARPGRPLGVLVIDDQAAVREGLARLLQTAMPALRFVAAAAGAAEAREAAARLRPDVVVLDADLDGEDGLALIPLIKPHAAVLVLTCHGDAATRLRAQALRADAFLEKHAPAAELLATIAELAHLHSREEEAPTTARPASHPAPGSSSAARAPTHP